MHKTTLTNDLLLRAARREPTERTPVWLMRQAGRTDPAYRQLRERVDLPLEAIFRDPDLAAEVSLLPQRIGVDAIIIFQDILTPLAPMGAEFLFRPSPTLAEPVAAPADIDRLRPIDPSEDLPFVGQTFNRIRTELAGALPVLGFAGAPLTLAFFLIEGGSPGDADRPFSLIRDDPATMHRLLDRLTDMTIAYLRYQIESGADAVQLFESLADRLTPQQYRDFAHPYHQKIFSALKGNTPTILFAKEFPDVALMADSGADVLSIGTCVDLAYARRQYGHRVAFQGNVDNRTLAEGTPEQIDAAVHRCVSAGGAHGHILNLNHGLLQETPFTNVRRFVEAAASAPAQPSTSASTASHP